MQELYLYLDAQEHPKQEQHEVDNTQERGCEEIDFTISEDNVTDFICL